MTVVGGVVGMVEMVKYLNNTRAYMAFRRWTKVHVARIRSSSPGTAPQGTLILIQGTPGGTPDLCLKVPDSKSFTYPWKDL